MFVGFHFTFFFETFLFIYFTQKAQRKTDTQRSLSAGSPPQVPRTDSAGLSQNPEPETQSMAKTQALKSSPPAFQGAHQQETRIKSKARTQAQALIWDEGGPNHILPLCQRLPFIFIFLSPSLY